MTFFTAISETVLAISSVVLSVAATALDAFDSHRNRPQPPEPKSAPDSLQFDYFYANKECLLLFSSIKRAAKENSINFNELEEVSLVDGFLASKSKYFQDLSFHALKRILLYDESNESFALLTKLAVHSKYSDFFSSVCLEKFKSHAKLFEKEDSTVKWDFVKVFAYYVSSHPKTPSKVAADFASFVFGTTFLHAQDPRLRESVRSTATFRLKDDVWQPELPPLFCARPAIRKGPDDTYKDDEFRPGSVFFVTANGRIKRPARSMPSPLKVC